MVYCLTADPLPTYACMNGGGEGQMRFRQLKNEIDQVTKVVQHPLLDPVNQYN